MPTETSSTTPAWDPTSHLSSNPFTCPSPATNASSAEPVNSSIVNRFRPQDQHVFLNPLLADKKINAIVNGGGYNQKLLEITISVLQNRVLLSHIKYGTSYPLKPEWVTPKHPSPTHDNGLLIVIKGDHCSKYVRRIHHRHSDTESTIILAVSKKVEGSADILTEERLELTPEYLSTVLESKSEKDLNKNLMKAVRLNYRK